MTAGDDDGTAGLFFSAPFCGSARRIKHLLSAPVGRFFRIKEGSLEMTATETVCFLGRALEQVSGQRCVSRGARG